MSRRIVIDANRIFSELIACLWSSDDELEIGLRKKGFTRFFAPPVN